MDWSGFAGAGSNLLGSVLGYSAAKSGQDLQRDINRENLASAREFAQNSIQWKVDDAKKAGIHPLAALGTQSAYAPSSYAGGDSGESQATMGIVSSLGQMLSTALEAINNDAQADKLGQMDNNTQFLKVEPDEVKKTAGKAAISMTNDANKSGQPLGAPLAGAKLVSLGNGEFSVEPNKDTIDAEALADAEGLTGVARSHFINQTYRRIAWSEVKRLNKKAGSQRYYLADRSLDGRPIIVDSEKNKDFSLDKSLQKLWNYFGNYW